MTRWYDEFSVVTREARDELVVVNVPLREVIDAASEELLLVIPLCRLSILVAALLLLVVSVDAREAIEDTNEDDAVVYDEFRVVMREASDELAVVNEP